MELNSSNYFSPEMSLKFLGVSQYKNFCGSISKQGCEERSLAILNGTWEEKKTTALLVGSFVDSFFEGTLDTFKAENPEIFTKRIVETEATVNLLPAEYITRNGTLKRDKLTEAKELYPDAFYIQYDLKADYKRAEDIIERTMRDELFMNYMSGQKQVIMTADMFGPPWKIKIDSYHPGLMLVDLKVMASLRDMKYSKDYGYMNFVHQWGYYIQGAVYQEVVYRNTGKRLPFFLAAVSKEEYPDIEIIQLEQNLMDEALIEVERNTPNIVALKNGEVKPTRCGVCDYCKHTKVLTRPIWSSELVGTV